ncbi:MAG: Patatin [Solirubrobacterales bacterium]|nr:Patatin [Solirubrobacterales bacterium]
MHANGNAEPTIGLVLPGGGARGAYEAGALSVLLPALEARGERVSIVCGTSVGAINAALVASLASLPAEDQAAAILARWQSVRREDILTRFLSPRLPLRLLRLFGEAVGLPGMRLTNLLDASPLRDSLDRWIDWDAIGTNVRRGHLRSLVVVATSLSRGRPVAFVHGRGPAPRAAGDEEIGYVKATIDSEHVRASAAIPILFPPVRVTLPRAAAGWYVDGGTRLNSPLKPALALGADRVLVVAFEPLLRRPAAPADDAHPHLADVAANVLDGLLVDQVVDDVHRLATVNAFFVEDQTTGGSRAARSYRTARGRAPYRKVSYAIVAPEEHGSIGRLAAEGLVRYGGLGGLREPDYALFSLLLGGQRASRGELLSFLFFDERYIHGLIAAGRADAERWLARHPRLWCSDPAHDLGVDVGDPVVLREGRALEEWRELRRR